MNIFKSTKKSNTIFFASLLLVGTIAAASSPLFMLGNAQAEPYYGMDKDRKDVSVSSLKCNNINVNVNGLELDILSPSLSTLLTGGEAVLPLILMEVVMETMVVDHQVLKQTLNLSV